MLNYTNKKPSNQYSNSKSRPITKNYITIILSCHVADIEVKTNKNKYCHAQGSICHNCKGKSLGYLV